MDVSEEVNQVECNTGLSASCYLDKVFFPKYSQIAIRIHDITSKEVEHFLPHGYGNNKIYVILNWLPKLM
jgi:hypothetical protein